MSLAELKQAVTALSAEDRHQLRDVLDALEGGVSVEELHAVDRALDEEIKSTEASIPAAQVWAEMDQLIDSLAKEHGS